MIQSRSLNMRDEFCSTKQPPWQGFTKPLCFLLVMSSYNFKFYLTFTVGTVALLRISLKTDSLIHSLLDKGLFVLCTADLVCLS